MELGVYVHFPYCLARCPYCDFALVVARQIDHFGYARAVIAELGRRAPAFAGRRVHTLYFGGGTPSLWESGAVSEVIAAVRSAFDVAPEAEVTLEANPESGDAQRFAAYRRLGVNRLSIGIQSFQPALLKSLGREHSADDAIRAVASARAAGFGNVCVDLMFGSPGETVEDARRDAEQVAALAPEHVSPYALTLESLAFEVSMARAVRRGRLQVPGQDEAADQGEAIRAVLTGAGYRRYEVSNLSRPGFESRHNLAYWKGAEYLGLGAGACGFAYADPRAQASGGRRYANKRSPMRYLDDLAAGGSGEDWSEPLGRAELLRERIMLGLRLAQGFDLGQACATFGESPERFQKPMADLQAAGLAVARDGWVALTPRGLDVHTEAAVRLM
jgi:putative oxygen-independent coproporphyrinogen III oxidase